MDTSSGLSTSSADANPPSEASFGRLPSATSASEFNFCLRSCADSTLTGRTDAFPGLQHVHSGTASPSPVGARALSNQPATGRMGRFALFLAECNPTGEILPRTPDTTSLRLAPSPTDAQMTAEPDLSLDEPALRPPSRRDMSTSPDFFPPHNAGISQPYTVMIAQNSQHRGQIVAPIPRLPEVRRFPASGSNSGHWTDGGRLRFFPPRPDADLVILSVFAAALGNAESPVPISQFTDSFRHDDGKPLCSAFSKPISLLIF